MKFGISIPGMIRYPAATAAWHSKMTPIDMVRVAQKADELGFDWIGVPDHIVMTEEWVTAMGNKWPHCLTSIAFFAGCTKRIKVTNTVLIAPYHQPVELAKMYSTLDYLSGGRLIVGLAVGYMEWEFNLLGVSFKDRGALTDECLDAMIELWTKDKPRYDGKFVQFDHIVFEPKPTQKPHPPIWIGGYSKASLRRAARVGDGWWPWTVARAQLPDKMEYMKSQPEWQKRPRPFSIIMPLFEGKTDRLTHKEIEHPKIVVEKDAILEQVGTLKNLGVTGTNIVTKPARGVEDYLESLEWFAQEILPNARD